MTKNYQKGQTKIWQLMIYLLLIILFLSFKLGGGKKVERLSDEDFNQQVLDSTQPVLVYFFNAGRGSEYKHMEAVLRKFQEIFENDIEFYPYPIKDRHEKVPYNVTVFGTMILFEDGKEIKRSSIGTANNEVLNRGRLFVFLKDYLMNGFLNSDSHNKNTEARFVAGNEFDTMVLSSSRPVAVNFSSKNCKPSQKMVPIFKALANEYGSMADFYLVENTNLENMPIMKRYGGGRAPSVIIFVDGEKKIEFNKGTYGTTELNKALVMGLLAPYLIEGL